MIQLWRDQAKTFKETVIINFMAYRYDHEAQQFRKEEERLIILKEECQILNKDTGNASEVMTDGAAAISRAAVRRILSASDDIVPEIVPGQSRPPPDEITYSNLLTCN